MRRGFAFTVVFVTALASVLRAQSTNASVTGRITDPSKALIVVPELPPSTPPPIPVTKLRATARVNTTCRICRPAAIASKSKSRGSKS